MSIKKRKTMPTLLVAVIVLLLLPGVACNLFTAQPEEPEVVEEPVVIEEPEPEEDPAFRPEQVLRLDFDDTVRSVAFNQDGTLFATGISNQIDVWNTTDGQRQLTLDELRGSPEDIAFSLDDQHMLVAQHAFGAKLYNLEEGQISVDFHGGLHNRLALSPDGARVATGNMNGLTWLWEVDTGEQIFEMNAGDVVEAYAEWARGMELIELAFSPDGRLVVAGHYDGMVFIWNAETGEMERLIEPETDRCTPDGLAFSNDGEILAVGGARVDFDEVVRLYRVSDGSFVRDLEHGSRGGTAASPVVFSPDGNLIAFGANDGIYIWSLPGYELLHTILIDETDAIDWVTDLAFSPDSQFLLAGYWDDYAILWQVQE